ncbi:hypothetical protein KJ636_04370 [Patescibacteria group bacterium]|nr:hypothetical protein [Patescibacteria group bacterium]MBU4481767.1 hypothetical protein [Patescibacteria group bacterium]
MPNEIESRGFKPRPKETKEGSQVEAIRRYAYGLENSLNRALPKLLREEKLNLELSGKLSKLLSAFFKDAVEKDGSERAVVQKLRTEEIKTKKLRTEEEIEAERLLTEEEIEIKRNLEIISAIGKFYEDKYPPVKKKSETKSTLEKTKIIDALKKGRTIFKIKGSILSAMRMQEKLDTEI